jgi:hypothetical protein
MGDVVLLDHSKLTCRLKHCRQSGSASTVYNVATWLPRISKITSNSITCYGNGAYTRAASTKKSGVKGLKNPFHSRSIRALWSPNSPYVSLTHLSERSMASRGVPIHCLWKGKSRCTLYLQVTSLRLLLALAWQNSPMVCEFIRGLSRLSLTLTRKEVEFSLGYTLHIYILHRHNEHSTVPPYRSASSFKLSLPIASPKLRRPS